MFVRQDELAHGNLDVPKSRESVHRALRVRESVHRALRVRGKCAQSP